MGREFRNTGPCLSNIRTKGLTNEPLSQPLEATRALRALGTEGGGAWSSYLEKHPELAWVKSAKHASQRPFHERVEALLMVRHALGRPLEEGARGALRHAWSWRNRYVHAAGGVRWDLGSRADMDRALDDAFRTLDVSRQRPDGPPPVLLSL